MRAKKTFTITIINDDTAGGHGRRSHDAECTCAPNATTESQAEATCNDTLPGNYERTNAMRWRRFRDRGWNSFAASKN